MIARLTLILSLLATWACGCADPSFAAGGGSVKIAAPAHASVPTLAAPTGLTTRAAGTHVSVLWDMGGVGDYEVDRATAAAGPWVVLAAHTGPAAGYTDGAVLGGVDYYYRVTAEPIPGQAALASAPAVAGPARLADTTAPAAPAVTATPSLAGVALSWPLNAEDDFDHYQLAASDDGGATWANLTLAGPTATGYADAAAPAGKARLYRLSAYDQSGNHASTTVAATRPAYTLPTIVPAAPSAVTTTSLAVNATVGAGNTVAVVSVDYGPTAAYGLTAIVPGAVAANGSANVSSPLSGLSPGTTVHYRVRATNVGGTTATADGTATTAAVVPTTLPTTVPVTPPATQPSVLPVTQAQFMAPAAVFVNAKGQLFAASPAGVSALPDPSYDFGDPSGKYNVVPAGFNGGHVYWLPGTYTITATFTAHDPVTRAPTVTSASATFTVLPDTRTKIYLNPLLGSDANSGFSAIAAVQTTARAKAIAALFPRDVAVLQARGTVAPLSSTWSITQANFLYADYGDPSAAKPRIVWTGSGGYEFNAFAPANGTTFLNVVGDSTDNTSGTGTKPQFVHAGGKALSLVQCDMLAVSTVVNSDAGCKGLLLQDCYVPQYRIGDRTYLDYAAPPDTTSPGIGSIAAYLTYTGSGTQDIVLLGNRARNITVEHVTRWEGFDSAVSAFNTWSNLDRTAVDKNDSSKASVDLHWGNCYWSFGDFFGPGPIGIGPLGGPNEYLEANPPGSTASHALAWAVVESATCDSFAIVGAGTTHAMIRNCVFPRTGSGPAILVKSQDLATTSTGTVMFPNRHVADTKIYFNTFADSPSVTNGQAVSMIYGAPGDVDVYGNLVVAPGLACGPGNSVACWDVEWPTLGSARFGGNLLSVAPPQPGVSGVNRVGGYPPTKPQWLGLTAWNALNAANGATVPDAAVTTTLSPDYHPTPATAVPAVLGCSRDFYGNARSTSATTAGAVGP